MYGLLDYGRMMADRPRRLAYEEVLTRVIKPSSTVLDLGCGLGIFTLLACRLGAQRVYAVDTNPCVEVARQVIGDNGFESQVEFFHGPSTEFQPEHLADVVIADLRSILPMAGSHLPALHDARQRLLRPGGTLIPSCDTLWMAAVDDAVAYRERVAPWSDGTCGFDFSAARKLTVHGWGKHRCGVEQLRSAPGLWATIDYADCADPTVRGSADLEIDRSGTVHGVVVWFDTELIDGITLSNAPDAPELVYGSAFFPFTEAIEACGRDRLEVEIEATLVGEEYVWTWSVRHLRGEDTLSSTRQSTFFSQILLPKRLARLSVDEQPTLDLEGQIDVFVLGQMDGSTHLGEMGDRLQHAFPQRFPDAASALDRVTQLARRYR